MGWIHGRSTHLSGSPPSGDVQHEQPNRNGSLRLMLLLLFFRVKPGVFLFPRLLLLQPQRRDYGRRMPMRAPHKMMTVSPEERPVVGPLLATSEMTLGREAEGASAPGSVRSLPGLLCPLHAP